MYLCKTSVAMGVRKCGNNEKRLFNGVLASLTGDRKASLP